MLPGKDRLPHVPRAPCGDLRLVTSRECPHRRFPARRVRCDSCSAAACRDYPLHSSPSARWRLRVPRADAGCSRLQTRVRARPSRPSRPLPGAVPALRRRRPRGRTVTATAASAAAAAITAMFSLQKTSKAQREARATNTVKKSAGQIRIQKDVAELDAPSYVDVAFPDPDNLMVMSLSISPEEGYYNGGKFDFTITVPADYPHSPPKVHCDTLVYHPNIDLEGNVCLNILRQEWKPVLTLSSVVYGLVLLFLQPNPDDPLNKDAADVLKRQPSQFRRNVDQSMRGGYVGGTAFKNCRR